MTAHPMNRPERRAVMLAGSVLALRMLGLFMILPLFSLHAGGLEGSTPLLIGLALGLYGLSQAVLQVPLGHLSDRIGRRAVIAAGLVVFVIGSLVAAEAESIWMLMVGRLLQGAGAIASTVLALVADSTRLQQRTKAMAMTGMGMGGAFLLAIVLGPVLAPSIGMDGIFYLAAVLGVAALALAGMLPKAAAAPPRPVLRGGFRVVLADPACLPWNVSIFLLHLVLTACFVALPLQLHGELGMPVADHAWVYFTAMVLSFVVAVPAMIISERRGLEVAGRRAAVLALAVGAATVAVAGTPGLAWLGLFVFFCGFNMLEASLPSGVSKRTPAGGRGLVMGVFSSHQFLGAFCGGVFGGWLLHTGNAAVVLAGVALLALAWLAGALLGGRVWSADRYVVDLASAPGSDQETWPDLLRDMPGVRDVQVVREEGAAYLRVDRRQFDPRVLWAHG